jgi:ribosomal protein S18 acetylase RimI-like enzyme
MDYVIRAATPHDLDGVNRVLGEVDAYHHHALSHIFRIPEGSPRAIAYLLAVIDADDAALYVAECDGTVIGVVQVGARSTPDIPLLVPRRYAVVETLAVLAAHRRVGVGRALMERAQRWTAEHGMTEIELNVWEFNRDAIAFYQALGYGTVRRTMHRDLGNEAESNGSATCST